MHEILESEREGIKEGMRKEKGFSLIELLIVVAIILIIAAIAVPNLLRSRMAANEASAASALRTVGTANVTYSSTWNQGFAGMLAHLGPPAAPPATSAAADLLDAVLSGVTPAIATPTKTGYKLAYGAGPAGAAPAPATPNATYFTDATPVTAGSSGQSTFCLDQTNVVRKDPAGGAPGSAAATGCAVAFGAPL